MTNNISFPHLGISMNISPVAFHIGAKPIYWYALIILTGFLLGLFLASWNSPKRGVKKDDVWNIALIGIVVGIICARIYYVLFALDEFKDNPLDVFKIWEGGLAIYGGIIGAIISTCVYCKVNKLNFPNVLDVCSPGLLLGQAIGRWGNFMNCEVFGHTTNSIFGMSINGAAPVQPLFLYESLWSFAGVILILIFRRRKTKNGQIFFSYLFWYSLGRLFLEGMRDPKYILYMIPGVLGISQFVAALLILLSIIGFIFVTVSSKKYLFPLPPVAENDVKDKSDKQD